MNAGFFFAENNKHRPGKYCKTNPTMVRMTGRVEISSNEVRFTGKPNVSSTVNTVSTQKLDVGF